MYVCTRNTVRNKQTVDRERKKKYKKKNHCWKPLSIIVLLKILLKKGIGEIFVTDKQTGRVSLKKRKEKKRQIAPSGFL